MLIRAGAANFVLDLLTALPQWPTRLSLCGFPLLRCDEPQNNFSHGARRPEVAMRFLT